ncbi:hypothetical protein FQN54_000464 [Arachnomyces sp. PD_36]|nr:hypothetical protein FQN54_000464 [Arachnomyces sp. PD_36]
MCGRYALGVRLAFVRQRLEQHDNRVDEAPDDDDVRETYNFAPGNYGAIYRADVSDRGAGYEDQEAADGGEAPQEQPEDNTKQKKDDKETKYKLQSMKWGLIPFWTKRSPNYGSLMKTINCRDDSLVEDRGMWTTMKKKKRCIVICQGFYEWLKKGPGGKERIPHYVHRKDGELMCFAGLWDCVKYEDSDEKLYTYTVITTSSNKYLNFLHDRMPVILDMGSPEMATWLDPHRTTWSKELQSLLKPYEGELECYPVSKEVGKVGNNSPTFIIPVNSKENKKNIANFFSGAATEKSESAKPSRDTVPTVMTPKGGKGDWEGAGARLGSGGKITAGGPEVQPETEDPKTTTSSQGVKRELSPDPESGRKVQRKLSADQSSLKPQPPLEKRHSFQDSKPVTATGRKTRSSTSNNSATKKPANGSKAKDGTQRITNFFKS